MRHAPTTAANSARGSMARPALGATCLPTVLEVSLSPERLNAKPLSQLRPAIALRQSARPMCEVKPAGFRLHLDWIRQKLLSELLSGLPPTAAHSTKEARVELEIVWARLASIQRPADYESAALTN
jgi:hypothetical protein